MVRKISSLLFITAIIFGFSFFLTNKVEAQTVPQDCTVLNYDLTLGSTGADVVGLQLFLQAQGYLVMPPGVPMGYFGRATRFAVGRFQTSQGISPADGYVGAITRARIALISCGSVGSTGLYTELVSSDADTNDDSTLGRFTFEVDVTAVDGDRWVELSGNRGTNFNSLGFGDYKTGFNYQILYNNLPLETGMTVESIQADKDDDGKNRVKINNGETVRFTVHITYDATVTGLYAANLYSINFASSNTDPTDQYLLLPEYVYRTQPIAIYSNSPQYVPTQLLKDGVTPIDSQGGLFVPIETPTKVITPDVKKVSSEGASILMAIQNAFSGTYTDQTASVLDSLLRSLKMTF